VPLDEEAVIERQSLAARRSQRGEEILGGHLVEADAAGQERPHGGQRFDVGPQDALTVEGGQPVSIGDVRQDGREQAYLGGPGQRTLGDRQEPGLSQGLLPGPAQGGGPCAGCEDGRHERSDRSRRGIAAADQVGGDVLDRTGHLPEQPLVVGHSLRCGSQMSPVHAQYPLSVHHDVQTGFLLGREVHVQREGLVSARLAVRGEGNGHGPAHHVDVGPGVAERCQHVGIGHHLPAVDQPLLRTVNCVQRHPLRAVGLVPGHHSREVSAGAVQVDPLDSGQEKQQAWTQVADQVLGHRLPVGAIAQREPDDRTETVGAQATHRCSVRTEICLGHLEGKRIDREPLIGRQRPGQLGNLAAQALTVELELGLIGEDLWSVGELTDRLEAKTLVPHRSADVLRRAAQRADRPDLLVAETRPVVGHDQRGVGEEEMSSATHALLDCGIVRILQQLKGITTGILLADQLLGAAALVKFLEHLVA